MEKKYARTVRRPIVFTILVPDLFEFVARAAVTASDDARVIFFRNTPTFFLKIRVFPLILYYYDLAEGKFCQIKFCGQLCYDWLRTCVCVHKSKNCCQKKSILVKHRLRQSENYSDVDNYLIS